MSNILIIESIGRPIDRDFSKTSVAHVRNAVIIAEHTGADIITCDRDMYLAEGKSYDHIICSYASPYMKYKTLIQVVRDNPQAKLWWLVNDHDLEDNILLRNVLKETNGERKFSMICNNSRKGYRGWILRKKVRNLEGEQIGILDDFIEDWHTVNLNALICSYHIPFNDCNKKYGLVYYGTMRKWRLPDLLKYQHSEMFLSATPRTQTKFEDKGVDQCTFVDKLSWQKGNECLTEYKASLYIEDEHTHDNYAFMANRFYESLMCNVVTFFDSKCLKNIKQSVFDIPDFYIVRSRYELESKVSQLQCDQFFRKCIHDNERWYLQAREEYQIVLEQIAGLLI